MGKFLSFNESISFTPKAEIAIVYCNFAGRFLFLRRVAQASDGGCWTAPSGKLEKGETPLEAAVRELQEETGFLLSSEKLLFVGSYCGRKNSFDMRIHIFYTELLAQPEVQLSAREHDRYEWILAGDVLSYPLMYGADECFNEMTKKMRVGYDPIPKF